jgi:hypothetical protein
MTRTLTKIPIDVSGATNRVDALDAALRRPGRFDRELVFPLPSLHARASILGIHTRAWAQPPTPDLLERLAQMCVGYCGADLKVAKTGSAKLSMSSLNPSHKGDSQQINFESFDSSCPFAQIRTVFNCLGQMELADVVAGALRNWSICNIRMATSLYMFPPSPCCQHALLNAG